MSRGDRPGARRRAAALAAALSVLLTPPASALAATTATAANTATAASTAPAVTTATNPLSGFPAPPVSTASSQTQPIITTASTGTAGSSSLSSGNAFAIAIGALVVLAGISFFIWRDARKRAPVKATGAADGGDASGRRGSKPPPKPRKPSPAERRRRKRGRARR